MKCQCERLTQVCDTHTLAHTHTRTRKYTHSHTHTHTHTHTHKLGTFMLAEQEDQLLVSCASVLHWFWTFLNILSYIVSGHSYTFLSYIGSGHS